MQGNFRRRHLPHWDVADAAYFVTACLAGSISASGMHQLQQYRAELDCRKPPPHTLPQEWTRIKHKLYFAKIDELLDGQPAVRHLGNSDAAECVRDSIYHFAGVRYDVIAYCVMPSHLHWVFQPLREWTDALGATRTKRTPREAIVHSVKSFTGTQCNQLLALSGRFWQVETYDHWVRDEDQLARIVEYVEQNPVKAGLVMKPEDWRWSSAADRRGWDLPYGEPLRPPESAGG